MSHVFFLPNFVTEKSGNRDVPLFGSVKNAKVPAPTPSLSLLASGRDKPLRSSPGADGTEEAWKKPGQPQLLSSDLLQRT